MITIAEAQYENDYRIKLKFNTDEEGVVDLSDLIERYSIAAPLKNIIEFQKFYLDEWPTLAWPCGFDLSPETLNERATGNKVKLSELKRNN
jgi:hypothetical protein